MQSECDYLIFDFIDNHRGQIKKHNDDPNQSTKLTYKKFAKSLAQNYRILKNLSYFS